MKYKEKYQMAQNELDMTVKMLEDYKSSYNNALRAYNLAQEMSENYIDIINKLAKALEYIMEDKDLNDLSEEKVEYIVNVYESIVSKEKLKLLKEYNQKRLYELLDNYE